METIEVIGLLFAGAMLGVVVTLVFMVTTYRDKALVPRHNGVPADLPPWAQDEMVRLRLENTDLRTELGQRKLKSSARRLRP